MTSRWGASETQYPSRLRFLARVLVLVVLAYVAVFYHPSESVTTPVSIKDLSSHIQNSDELKVSVAVENSSPRPRVVKVAWYLSYPDDRTPWLTGFFASSWQSRVVGPSSTMVFRSKVIAAIPTGAYELSAYLHGPGKSEPIQYDEASSRSTVDIVNRDDFFRATTSGPAYVAGVTVPKESTTQRPLLNIDANVSLRFPKSFRHSVWLTWGLVAKGTLRSNTWASAPTLVAGQSYRVDSPSSRVNVSSGAIGVPGRSYALRLQVYDGKQLSDSVVVPALDLVGGAVSTSIERTYYPPATVPLVITNLSLPPRWSAGSNPTVSVTVSNISDQRATGQLILQVGRVGDPTPWKDPAYSFPLVTFSVPERSTRTLHVLGNPSLKSGQYELGVYVHYDSGEEGFEPGDQVFARSRVTVDGAS